MEGRYFEVLMESMPLGMVTIFAQLNLNEYNWFVITSILASCISVGSGTANYFSRSHAKGNPMEFRPLILSSYLWILLGFCTTLDYLLRIYAPLLLIDVIIKTSHLWPEFVWIVIIAIVILLVLEMFAIYWIHGDKSFAIGFGWLALYGMGWDGTVLIFFYFPLQKVTKNAKVCAVQIQISPASPKHWTKNGFDFTRRGQKKIASHIRVLYRISQRLQRDSILIRRFGLKLLRGIW